MEALSQKQTLSPSQKICKTGSDLPSGGAAMGQLILGQLQPTCSALGGRSGPSCIAAGISKAVTRAHRSISLQRMFTFRMRRTFAASRTNVCPSEMPGDTFCTTTLRAIIIFRIEHFVNSPRKFSQLECPGCYLTFVGVFKKEGLHAVPPAFLCRSDSFVILIPSL